MKFEIWEIKLNNYTELMAWVDRMFKNEKADTDIIFYFFDNGDTYIIDQWQVL